MLDEGGPTFKTPSAWPGHQERLAAMLRKLIKAERAENGPRVVKLQAARDCFYRGEVADELDAWWRSMGCFLRKADLEAHVTRVEDPVSVKYEGLTVHKCGPWTAGPMLLQSLRLVEGFDFMNTPHHSVEHIHFVRPPRLRIHRSQRRHLTPLANQYALAVVDRTQLTEAMKLGFADRDEYYADPRFTEVPLPELLSDEYTAVRKELIQMDRASELRQPGNPWRYEALLYAEETAEVLPNSVSGISGLDTTTCVTADRFGNVVAATPSCESRVLLLYRIDSRIYYPFATNGWIMRHQATWLAICQVQVV